MIEFSVYIVTVFLVIAVPIALYDWFDGIDPFGPYRRPRGNDPDIIL